MTTNETIAALLSIELKAARLETAAREAVDEIRRCREAMEAVTPAELADVRERGREVTARRTGIEQPEPSYLEMDGPMTPLGLQLAASIEHERAKREGK